MAKADCCPTEDGGELETVIEVAGLTLTGG